MAIHKKVPDPAHPGETIHLVIPEFSFATNTPAANNIAQLIVDAWAEGAGSPLLARDGQGLPTGGAVQEATRRVRAAGLDLTRAVVITEAEHGNDYIMQSDSEIVFVLPDKGRVVPNAGHLLDTAKFLMACTPNGI